MNQAINYQIPDHYEHMARLAGPMALRVAKRLYEKLPTCRAYGDLTLGCPELISRKLADLQELVPEVNDAVNHLALCTREKDVVDAMVNLEFALDCILDSLDEVKAFGFEEITEVKILLQAVMVRPVQDTALMLQALNQIVMQPEQYTDIHDDNAVFDLTITFDLEEEMRALEAWVNKQHRTSGGGWGTLLGAFALGWWMGSD